MSIPTFSMKELLEAGIHFGHQVNKWNPKMQTYLYGERNGIHIIDLQQTAPLLHSALNVLRDIASSGGRILFVGTKRQAQKIVAETAVECGQYFVNHRWLGGTLTNWNTISNSIVRLKKHDETLNNEETGLTKKELVGLTRQRDKLNLSLGGIKEMGGRPDALFVIDTNKEKIAVNEAVVLGIPIVAILDSNSDPDGVDYPIPGNDDATRAISMYCKLVSESILDGLKHGLKKTGADIGSMEGVLNEKIENNKEIKSKVSKTQKGDTSSKINNANKSNENPSKQQVGTKEKLVIENKPKVVKEEKVEKNNESQEAKEKKEQKHLQVETSKVEKVDAKESEISIEEKVEESKVSKVSKEESEATKLEEEKTDKTKKF